ncbi:MAG: hypothetical protein KDA91_21895, partial [Planctomycetaceae bacterium]|nr:hypothetical protein [Planctomycetaceae bacterium]
VAAETSKNVDLPKPAAALQQANAVPTAPPGLRVNADEKANNERSVRGGDAAAPPAPSAPVKSDADTADRRALQPQAQAQAQTVPSPVPAPAIAPAADGAVTPSPTELKADRPHRAKEQEEADVKDESSAKKLRMVTGAKGEARIRVIFVVRP